MPRTLRFSVFAIFFLLIFLLGVSRESPPLLQGNAERPRYLLVPAPDKFANLVAEHIDRMFRAGHFRSVSEKDFFHGHLVMAQDTADAYDSLEELLEHAALVLYHTGESTDMWVSQNGVAPEKRTQRSVIGYPDGSIKVAIELIATERRGNLSYYVSHGTISNLDLTRENPALFRPDTAPVYLKTRLSKKAKLFISQFTMYPDRNGRFSVGDVRYNICFTVEAD